MNKNWMKIKKSFLYNKYGGMYTGNIIYQVMVGGIATSD
jgi:hypothetical protein